MALMDCSFYSYEMGMDIQFQVIVPESRIEKRMPDRRQYRVLYCLHGHSRDHSTFSRYGILEQLLGNSDVIAVIPNMHRSFCVNEKNGYRYFSYLTEELPTLIANLLPVSNDRKDTFICGFSMGGYGALRSALKRPDLYSGAAVFSVASEPFECMDILQKTGLGTVPDIITNMERVFGSRSEFPNTDCCIDYLLDTLDISKDMPLIYHACGSQDLLYDMNIRLKTKMMEKYPMGKYIYQEKSGFHDWNFWNNQLKEMIAHFKLV